MLVIGLIALVVVAGTVGGILGFRLLGGSADSLVSMAPSDSIVYVNLHLDPSGGQKLALNGLLDKFPSLSGSSRDNTINGWLDSALQSTGLTHNDVRPWLGNDISVVVPASALNSSSSSSGGTPDLAVLVSSTNDGAAQAAVDKLRQKSGGGEQWSTSSYDGVTLTTSSGDQSAVFAVTDHALIIGTTASATDQVIDTAQGKHAALQSNGNYSKALGEVPSDRIALLYVDAGTALQQATKGAGQIFGQQPLAGLQAVQGIALAVVAQSNGISITGAEDYDTSKMTADQKAQLNAAPHANSSLAFMPRSAYAAVTLTGLKDTISSAVNQFGSALGLDLNSILQQIGITGPNGILSHLNGDAGAELSTASQPLGGTLVVGTDSDSAAQQFVTSLMTFACGGQACDPTQVTQQQDGDAVISSLPGDVLGISGIQPSWAVYHGWMIVGSSPDQVKAALDADRSGATLSSNPNYSAVMSQVGGSNNGAVYVDIQQLLTVIRGSLSPDDQHTFDTNVAPNVKPLKAFGAAEHNASDHVTINMFTLIQ